MKKKPKILLAVTIIMGLVITGGITVWLLLRNPPSFLYEVENAFPNLSFSNPVGIYAPEDGTNRLFVVEQGGDIIVFENDNDTSSKTIFLDFSSEITFGGEQGLLGLAFHPDYGTNGYYYIYYIDEVSEDTVVSRFKVNSTDINNGNKSSEMEILRVPQPYSNHNGGQIAFGPDGYLYIALGDGGSGFDPLGHGQNRTTLLGSILRIDVDSGSPYDIPVDNPFFGNMDGYMEQIFAFGFRNPWRFSFDSVTGDLWVADVGQNTWEEINIVENGKNYGWNTREGAHDLYPGTNVTETTDPVWEYNHSLGNSITGGYVYHGSRLPKLTGRYIYGDYGSGRIWALEYSDGAVVQNTLLKDSSLGIPSFGVDASGEIFICAFDGYIYQLIEIEDTTT